MGSPDFVQESLSPPQKSPMIPLPGLLSPSLSRFYAPYPRNSPYFRRANYRISVSPFNLIINEKFIDCCCFLLLNSDRNGPDSFRCHYKYTYNRPAPTTVDNTITAACKASRTYALVWAGENVECA